MKITKHIMLASVLMMAVACLEMPDADIVPQVGTEVQFGLSLGDGIKTRTVYGEETSTGFPVYWVNGDQVLIASPQCLNGRNSARYEVSCSTSVQSTADAISKVDDAGIQWGDVNNENPVHFYSIYPAQGNKLVVNNGSVEATLKVASTQYAKISVSSDGSTIYAQPADMGNVIMYDSVESKYGASVQLSYKPFSTVIEFTTQTPGFAAGNQPLTIQSLTLTAPADGGPAIAGDFKFDFDGPSIDPITETGSKSITVHFVENNEYTLKIDKQQLIKIKMCVMPTDKIKSLQGWTVVLATSAGNFTKTLAGSDANGKTTSLAPGKVHKIVLPTLSFSNKEWEYSGNNWITSIPDYKKVYLTELSLPGAWYALHDNDDAYQFDNDPQNTEKITSLWNKGVRAFAIETKTTTTSSNYSIAQTEPIGVIVSGTGDNSSSVTGYKAGGYNSIHGEDAEGDDGRVYKGGIRISSVIKAIATKIPANEFGVLILSYADGGASGKRYVDYGAWINLLQQEYTSSGVTDKIYSEDIDENTTIEDVLGKLIIKVNVDQNIAEWGKVNSRTYNYNNNLPALFSYTPFVHQIKDYTNLHYSSLYWQSWDDDYRGYLTTLNYNTGFYWCFSSANRTQADNGTNGDLPTYEQRKNVLLKMMQKSKEVYDKSNHNIWFYFNCGGTQASSLTSDGSATDFAGDGNGKGGMNQWLLDRIEEKTDASPLGIVMFNQCLNDTYHGPAIIKAIVEMNSKFYLKHEGDYDFERPVTEFDNSHVGVDSWDTGFIQ